MFFLSFRSERNAIQAAGFVIQDFTTCTTAAVTTAVTTTPIPPPSSPSLLSLVLPNPSSSNRDQSSSINLTILLSFFACSIYVFANTFVKAGALVVDFC